MILHGSGYHRDMEMVQGAHWRTSFSASRISFKRCFLAQWIHASVSFILSVNYDQYRETFTCCWSQTPKMLSCWLPVVLLTWSCLNKAALSLLCATAASCTSTYTLMSAAPPCALNRALCIAIMSPHSCMTFDKRDQGRNSMSERIVQGVWLPCSAALKALPRTVAL